MNDIDRIASLLRSDAIEKRIAAAIVLGELKAKGADVVEGLVELLGSDVPALQRHGLDALAKVGAKKAIAKIFPLLGASDPEVRRSAAHAIVSVGDDVVPTIRARMASAEPEERRALDGILAELGGKEAFTALLAGLAGAEGEAAKASAIAVRQRVKGASATERRGYLSETEKFLKAQKKAGASGGATAAAIKILGYLEDERVVPLLLEYATASDQPAPVRQEAIVALRFSLGKNDTPKAAVVNALLDAALDPDRPLAQTALHTLGSLELSADHAKKLERLVGHPDIERARFVIEQLGRQRGADAAKVLVKVLREPDKRRAELAAAALAGNDDAVPLLAKALLETTDADRGWAIRKVLQPSAKKMSPALRKPILEAAIERLGSGDRGWEALLDVARDADADACANALRALVTRLRKADNTDKSLAVLSILCRTDRATDDDRYVRATLELARSVKDTRPAARRGDEALTQLGALLDRGYDVAKALRADKAIELETLYYVGFHFVEEGHPIGEELLEDVVKKGGRAKVARMARNKLSLAEGATDVGGD